MKLLERASAALSYFTRLPSLYPQKPRPPKGSACYAPLAGWVVGLAVSGVYLSAEQVLPTSVAVALSMAFTLWLTRGLHEDGWSDFCDGFGGAWDRDRTLEIMRDPSCGVFGVLGLLSVLLVKFTSVVELVQHHHPSGFYVSITLMFVSAHALSRLASVSMMYQYDYAGDAETTRAGQMSARMRTTDWLIACGFGLAPLVGLSVVVGSEVLALIFLLWAARLVLARQILIRLGGYTGDCMGAIQQVSEVVFYVGLLIVFDLRT